MSAVSTTGQKRLGEMLARSVAEMRRRDLARLRDCDEPFAELGDIAPVDCLMAAAATGLLPAHPPRDHADGIAARNQALLRQLVRKDYSVRPARTCDLPALMTLERRCWEPALRTPEAVVRQRLIRYPQGQLVLVLDDAIAGVIYSQRVACVSQLDGVTAAEADRLHDGAAKTVQLLAVNILPDVQHRNLGDELLEFMLIYRSLQPDVAGVVAVTRCKAFDRAKGLDHAAYIRHRNGRGVLADPILRFHELHGATIERVMPGYRPDDTRNEGSGVLVSYDIRSRSRRDLRADAALERGAGASRPGRRAIRDDVGAAVCDCLGESRKAAFAFRRPLMEMGLDSADLLGLSERLAHRHGLRLSPTFFFEHNTAERVAAYLSAHVGLDGAAGSVGATRDNPDTGNSHSAPAINARVEIGRDESGCGVTRRDGSAADVAIVGMACRLPGAIDTPDDFWACLAAGRSVIGDLPPGRWTWPAGIDPVQSHPGIDRGGFLSDVAMFDAPFFRISAAEAESTDPQQRILMELAWQAIEHAGYAADSLAGSKTGVFIGASGSDYARLLDRRGQAAEAHYGTGSSMAVLANRISYFYDFRAPSLTLDTACSSSLVAVHEAVQSIARGESSQALVGGINLILHPANSVAYYKTGMLSKDGRCKAFDQNADGYVRSEGAVMLLLKPLQSALSDGDRIHAVIKGTACNHGGQASGLTVPNPEQQGQLLNAAWQAAGIDAPALGYIEAHGTGTPLGDPVEVQGIKQAIAQAAGRNGARAAKRCGLGSVKSNLGHLEAAAGLAGLLKAVLCLQHRLLPPSLNFHELNAHIDLAESGLYVVDRLQGWAAPADGAPRMAGVSSFGSGGTNAHVVVEEYPAAATATTATRETAGADEGPVLFVLSARTKPQLQAYARHYADWLATDAGQAVGLRDLAWQLQTGRQAMDARLALVVADRGELIRKLGAFDASEALEPIDGNSVGAGIAELGRLASLWLAGTDVDWSRLHARDEAEGWRPRRIAVPTYRFARRRYWLPQPEAVTEDLGLEERPRPEPEVAQVAATLLAPIWRAVGENDARGALFPAPGASVLIVGANAAQRQAIRSVYGAAHALDIDPAATIDALAEQLRGFGALDHIVWVASQPGAPSSEPDTLIERQGSGLLHVFKLVKALLALSYGERALGWTIVTRGTQAVFGGDVADPADAGVHGLFGVLAKEFPRWPVRALDLACDGECPLQDMLHLPVDSGGEVLAHRSGQWFRRALSPVSGIEDAPPLYRQNGVYVVIGGAGGVGEAWTRHAIEQYRAQVIWIGRRQHDEVIKAKIDALARVGPAPIYIAADASHLDALEAAYREIKSTWPTIHGVIHAATGAFDRSVAETDEMRLGEILSAKIDASVRVAQVFGAEPLDFILYFSSIVGLEKSGGFCGYAAGCAFEDAFALHFGGLAGCPVKVMDWGHWDVGTGAAISAAAKTRLRQSGAVPIAPDEAMAALHTLLRAPVGQMVLLKTARLDAASLVDTGQNVAFYADARPPRAGQAQRIAEPSAAQIDGLKPVSLFNNAALEAELQALLAATLPSIGRRIPAGALDFYQNWLDASWRLLAEQGAERTGEMARAWPAWETAKRDRLGHADLQAAVELAEACLRALPDILSGRLRATDVLFPDASMRRVEGIYRDNAVADHFNRVLADALVAEVESRLKAEPDARLRILEVGAGTGGTTAMVLPRLAPHRQSIADYAYTDVSKAFLFHAEAHFVGPYPFVRPMLLDVEKPLAGQGVEAQGYDVVIATNVLHATRDIRQTLSTCKAALRKGGLLLLNEISCRSVFAHVTFGLLEGWWRAHDQSLRIPDAPGLSPEAWQTVLAQEGFLAIAFAAPGSHVLGQQVIVAESDGIVRQQVAPASVGRPVARALPPAGVVECEGASASPPEQNAGGMMKAGLDAHLKKLVARTLRMDSGEIDVREPLGSYGLDSILVVQITEALRQIFPDVRKTLLFECQTIEALSAHFLRHNRDEAARLINAGGPRPANVTASPRVAVHGGRPPRRQDPHAARDSIAVIGMSCRFPQANTADDFWRLLKEGRSAVRDVPAERWPIEGFFLDDPDEAVRTGKSYSKWGGFLDCVTEFDPLFFNISPKDAAAIDPQERLFLQTAWETLEDAGYTRARLAKEFRQQLGVFVGITRTGFDLFGPPLWQQGETVYPHTSFSSAANRVSYFLNARGPSVPVDTMCSSSLTAIHQACQSLHSGECEVAIAGGVNVYLHPSGYVGLSAARMLSKDGVCRSFGAGANGFVPGEGVAAILLKPLERAIADNDRIYAKIRATHVNHGGKTNGYTVPNPVAQADLVRDALTKAGVDARAVSYIEAHGTGTELGDPIEVAGLTDAFRHFTADSGFCALGSAKANIGHLEAAAGIAGFIKVVLQMRHGQIAPSLHADKTNPNIDFATTPFVVQQGLAEWRRPAVPGQGEAGAQPRIAGISSFGAGGANAHVVVEEYVAPEPLSSGDANDAEPACAIVLSARNEERLQASVRRLSAFLDRRMAEGEPPLLTDLAYTLQVGREQMGQRLALVVASVGELKEKLDACIGGAEDAAHVYRGHAKHHKAVVGALAGDEAMEQTLAIWFSQGAFDRVLNLWAAGLDIDWERLHQAAPASGRRPRRIALPTYPFATTRYWLPVLAPGAEKNIPAEETPARATPVLNAGVLQSTADAVAAPKPDAIKLLNAASVPTAFQAETAKPLSLRPLHTYAAATDSGEAADSAEPGDEPGIDVYDCGGGVLAVRVGRAIGQGIDAETACTALAACVEWVDAQAREASGQMPPVKALVVSGLDRLFPGRDTPAAAARLEKTAAALTGCVVPVVAALTGDNRQGAMRMAAACDLMICSAEGSYTFEAATLRGDALRRNGFTMPIVASVEDAVEVCALNTARDIARGSFVALAALKAHLARRTSKPSIDRAAPPPCGVDWPAPRGDERASAPVRVTLSSEVVTLDRHANGVAVMTLCNRAGKNTFSPAFVDGVLAAFAHVHENPAYKAVVLTGYETYFACGGTRDGLLAIQSGKARFTDEQSYVAPLHCDIPVIAAMQGHGIGAGWAMGLFCDWAVYSEESVYQSPYMLYGFTPGAGSTLIFPERLGVDLSREVLLTARAFQGRELKQRGIPMPVVARSDVLGHALALANRLAASPRDKLVLEKNARARVIRERLQATFDEELGMHDTTFVGNTEVVANVARYFNDAARQDAAQPATQGNAGSDDRLLQRVLDELRQSLADELNMQIADVDDHAAFIDIGMDSISAVTWIRKINKRFGLSIAATKVYSHPTLNEFHRHVVKLGCEQGVFDAATQAPGGNAVAEPATVEAEPSHGPPPAPILLWSFPLGRADLPSASQPLAQAPAAPPARLEPETRSEPEIGHAALRATQPIAIVGMAGQFPKAASVQQFWRNVREGRDCVSDVPASRWPIDAYYDPDRTAPGKTVCKRMGVLEDVEAFDPLFFNISPSEAEYMDPQQRLFLENSWRCIEDAGYDPTSFSGRSCGVFVGCGAGDYSQRLAGMPPSAHGLIGESASMLPARVAYFMNLRGPSLAIDTACSASLVAIANACDSLVLGNCDLALAGGVYVMTGADIHVKMSSAGMLSPDGRCYSFDQRANGFVPGEGVGVLLLKRLDDALRDGDPVRGVIRGWGINQDGRTNGITAPSQEQQTSLEAGVYRRFGINPEHIQLVEAHGTGTKLGDPIEVDALRESFRQFTDAKNFCALGSVKSNIGHLATAAGVTGVIKSVLALQDGQLPPTINYTTPNEHIALDDSPFYVNTECKPWPAATGQKRLVAVSSFGFSGTNAHVVLEEFTREAGCGAGATEHSAAAVLLPLSAKSHEQLAQYAQAVSDYLADEQNIRDVGLANIASTFQMGRPALNHRLAVVANNVEDLRRELSAYASAGATGANCFSGTVADKAANASGSSPTTGTGTGTSPENLADAARRWVAGEAIGWASLHLSGPVRRVHGLPTYPFARERYWIGRTDAGESASDSVEPGGALVAPADGAVWQSRDLAAADWQIRLKHWLGKTVVVIHANDDERLDFERLLSQLKRSCGMDRAVNNVAYCRADDADAAAATARADCVLLLGSVLEGGTDNAAAVSRWFDIARDGAAIVAFMHADATRAERVGDQIAEAMTARPQSLLVISQSDCSDGAAALQRLFREWLALAESTRATTLSEIHYAGARRLQRTTRVEMPSESVCLIRKEWRLKAPELSGDTGGRGTVLVLVNDESRDIAKTLLEPDDFERIVLISDTRGSSDAIASDAVPGAIDFGCADAARRGAQALVDADHDITHVIDLAELLDTPADNDCDPSGKVAFYQTLVGSCDALSIAYVTKGLQAFRARAMSLGGARFAGLVRMLSADYRHIDARLIDIDQAAYDSPRELRRILLQEFDSALMETEACYREGHRFVPLLTAAGRDPKRDGAWTSDGAPMQIREDAVYVISGGTNGVGLEIAKHLVARGCRKLVLMGITPLPAKERWAHAALHDALAPSAKSKMDALIALRDAVDHLEIHTGALTDLPQLRRYFMKIRATLGPIRGVIHSAAVYSDAARPGFAEKRLDHMRQVWEPKIDGLLNLHAVFKADALDFFVSFASLAGLVPHLARGASDYAMANAFVEFFAAYQQHQGGTFSCKTIAWPDWNETGALTRIADDKAAAVAEAFGRLGLRTFSNREGCRLFEQAMAADAGSHVVIAPLDRRQFAKISARLLHADLNAQKEQAQERDRTETAARAIPPLKLVQGHSLVDHLERWEAAKRSGLEVSVQRITEVVSLDEIRALDPSLIHRIHALLFAAPAQEPAASGDALDYAQVITTTVLGVLKLKTVSPAQPLQDYGLDSISATVLAMRLEKMLKLEIRPHWLIEFPTIETLARHLVEQADKSSPT